MNIPQEKLDKQTLHLKKRSGEQQLGCTGEQGLPAYNLMPWPDSKHKLFCHAGEWPPGNQRRGKMIHALFLRSKWENVLTLQQKVQKVVLFSFPNSYFPAFMAGCYRHKEALLLLHLSLSLTSASGNVIMKHMKV